MPCYHPLKGFVCGKLPSGKLDLKVCSFETDHVEIMTNGSRVPVMSSFRSGYAAGYITEWMPIPCGQCLGCRLEYSKQWAARCMLELESHDVSYFVTLTYNDNHLPLSFSSDPGTGLAYPSATLCKRDVQLFFKRLRKAFPNDHIRYYGCGEYGPEHFRPHYHFIIYGLHLDDLVPYKRSREGFWYYRSERLERVWSFPCRDDNGQYIKRTDSVAGFVTVADVSWQTCAYVARYMTKKLKGNWAEFYDALGIIPPCSFCSRRPGIGSAYFHEHMDSILDTGRIHLATPTGGVSFNLPNYYKDLYDEVDPVGCENFKYQNQQAAKLYTEAKLAQTDLSYLELLAVEEEVKRKQTKLLCRSDL